MKRFPREEQETQPKPQTDPLTAQPAKPSLSSVPVHEAEKRGSRAAVWIIALAAALILLYWALTR